MRYSIFNKHLIEQIFINTCILFIGNSHNPYTQGPFKEKHCIAHLTGNITNRSMVAVKRGSEVHIT